MSKAVSRGTQPLQIAKSSSDGVATPSKVDWAILLLFLSSLFADATAVSIVSRSEDLDSVPLETRSEVQ